MTDMAFSIRKSSPEDHDALWRLLQPVIESGETYALPRDYNREQSLTYWCSVDHQVFVAADEENQIVGTYFLAANQKGGGSHVANCGYITLAAARGRGVARAMCAHSLDQARVYGFKAMQFNFVVSSNVYAVKLWRDMGFWIVGVLPDAFLHPTLGFVDAFIMFRPL